MKNNPLISIGLPVYNGELFLRKTINSVLTQTFRNFELIILDNVSIDSTKKICKAYKKKDNRIKYIRQKVHVPGFINFKNALDEARAKYFMWIAADDMFGDENYLQIIVKKISYKYNFYFTDVSTIDDKGKIIKPKVMQRFENCKTKYDFFKETIYICSYQFYGLYERLKLIKDFKYLEIARYYKCFNEGLFLYYVVATRKVKFIKDAVKFYRVHPNQLSSSSKLRAYQLIISWLLFFYRGVHLILILKNFSFKNKMNLIAIQLKITTKFLLVLILGSIWQIAHLKKNNFFLKLKSKFLSKLI
jgi:glycosyltransferase involved in cell wall biosynthesis